jgi:signal transduction histidine kinase/ligand-binding sensor domain-containing protein
MHKIIAVTLFQLFVILFTANSQNIKFNRIRQEDGLIHEHVLCMHKDSRGFMWIGTYGGIERYDGYEHRYYISNMNRPTGVNNYTFHCIYEDKKGGLWFGTQGGLYRYMPEVDTFFSYQHIKENPNSISNDNVRSIVRDNDGDFWVGTYGGGLNRFVPDSNKFYHFVHDSTNPYSLSCDLINTLFVDSKGQLWIGTDGGGLSLFDKKNGKFSSYKTNITNPNSLQSNIINSIGEDSTGNIWIGTWDGGLSVFNPVKNSFLTYKNEPDNPNSLSNNIVRALVIDKENYIWLATFGGGLDKFNPRTKKFTVYKNDPFNPASLSLDILWSIYENDDGILWIGTFGAGVCKYDRNKNKFQIISRERDKKNTLSSNNISALLVDHEGIIWIGTPGNGLNSHDRIKGTYNFYLNRPNDPTSFIRTIYEDPINRLWVGTDNGVFLFNDERKIIRYYQNDPKLLYSISSKSIESMCMDKYGNMWFASWNDGLFMLRKEEIAKENSKDARFVNYRHNQDDPKSLAWDIVWKVYSDKNGNIWAGTDKTFDLFNDKDQTFSHRNYRMVNTIWEEPSGIMWLGTFGFGLYKFDPGKDTASVFKEKDGFSNIVFLGIVGDKENNLWISTEGGIFEFNPKSLSVINYSDKEGLQGNKFTFNAYALSNSGEILFGGNNGFNLFYPGEIRKDTSKPEIVFTDFKLFNKSVSYEKSVRGSSLIKKQLFLTDTITLSHSQNFISFEFTALCFSNPGDVIYRYKLDGFDKDWHFTNALRHEATYTNLNPGIYKFVVESTNGDGIWSGKSAAIMLIIKPAWYQRLLFKFTLLVLLVFILYIIYLLRIRQIKNRNIFLEKLINERTDEIRQKNLILQLQAENLNDANALLEERQQQIEEQTVELSEMNKHLLEVNATKDKFFSIIAHDLKNPFGSLLGFVELLKKNGKDWDEDKKEKVLDIIDSSSKVIFDLLENLLYWSRSQTNRVRFEPKYISLVKIAKENLLLLKENYINKKIKVITSIPDNIKIYADSDMFNTILRNLLSNAIKFTPEAGFVEFKCEVVDHELLISIKDSGIGITDELKPRIFHLGESVSRSGTDGERGTGLGLLLCKEFVEKHGGKIYFDSEVNKGTTFFVSFKEYQIDK